MPIRLFRRRRVTAALFLRCCRFADADLRHPCLFRAPPLIAVYFFFATYADDVCHLLPLMMPFR